MRITQQLISNLVRQRSEAASQAFYEVTRKIGASSAVERPSDDPVAAARLQNINRFGHQLDMLDRSRRTVQTDLTMAESIIGDMNDVLVEAKDVALAMSSDGVNAEDRKNGAVQIERLLNELTGLANRQQTGGRYLFGGLSENQPPLDGSGNYQGDASSRLVEIGPGVQIEATVSGHDVFGPSNEVLTTLRTLVTALNTNDTTQIRASLDDLDQARDIVTLARTEVGSRLATINDIDVLSGDLRVTMGLEHAAITGIDLAELAPQLSAAQNVLQAVVQTSQTLMQQASAAWLR